jgi:phosphatidate cytidylyltransferase
MARSGGELAKRVGVALVGIPIAVGLVYLGGYPLAGFLALLAALGAWEFAAMYRESGVMSAPAAAALLGAAYVALAAALGADRWFIVGCTVVTVAVGTVAMLTSPAESQPGRLVMVSLFGGAYTGVALAFAVWLRAVGGAAPGLRGTAVVMLPVAITWLGDTAAYFVGTAFGRHKMAPLISPKKTWEGAAAGLVAAAAGAVLFAALTGSLVSWTMSTVELLGFGAVVAVVGQLGDLFESRFKRDCGVKDSSHLLPGHGGVLDRLDALLFVFPFAYLYILAVGV